MAIANSTNTDETGVQTFSATTGDWVGSTTTQYIVQLGDTGNKLTGVSGTGTAAQVLTSNGAGLAPTWQDAPTATDLHVARFIVHPSGTSVGANYTTIASAIAAASAGDTIHIQSKATAYNEDFTLPTGVDLVAYVADAYTPNVVIKGKITATSTGSRSISGIQLETDGDNILEITGSNAVEVNLINCYLDIVDATAIDINNGNAVVNLYHCKGDIQDTGITVFSVTNCDTLNFEYCYFDNSGGSSTQSTIASGNVRQWWSRFANRISVTGDGEYTGRWSRLECYDLDATALTLNTSSNDCNAFHCVFTAGTATCIVITAGRLRCSHL